ncbi:MAG: tRNA-2-methylthio-N(6)-dimethylallyladenosine synthase [Patescibacteria group bacterium]|nr:MAG: tRNA-2-methylthio-N(6)-dimethylallyladenosine synthase [Patescibacteria group bacterium]
MKSKTYYIKTYGCQANTADSGTIAGILEAVGFEPLAIPKFKTEKEELQYVMKNTDLFIINSCSVRQKSEDKVYGIGKVVKEAEEIYNQKPFIVLAGCMVGSVTGERQRYEFSQLKRKTPWVDLYMNPLQVSELPLLLKREGILGDWAKNRIKNIVGGVKDTSTHAFVNISQGCDNFCSFCVVPYARGREVSRPKEDIFRDVRRLVKKGATEITLCGQNVNSWGLSVKEKFHLRAGSDHKLPFASLLREIHDIPEIKKISFVSSNPFDFTKDLIETLKLPKIDNYVHIAVQSGNNDVLQRMNRRHTVEDFTDLINQIKKVKKNIEIGTDLIVGFPGETREQFMDTVQLVKKVKFSVCYIAMYSPRKGTYAEKTFDDDVPQKEKKYRHDLLTKVWLATKRKQPL